MPQGSLTRADLSQVIDTSVSPPALRTTAAAGGPAALSKVYSTDNTDANAKYGKVDASQRIVVTGDATAVPIPVAISTISGSVINVTAGDIDIHTTSEGAAFDGMRIGDGTGTYLSTANINTNIDAALSTLATETTLLSVDAYLLSIDTQLNGGYGDPFLGIRTASQIGNDSGAADFNDGVSTSQTLRVAPSDSFKTATSPLQVQLGDGFSVLEVEDIGPSQKSFAALTDNTLVTTSIIMGWDSAGMAHKELHLDPDGDLLIEIDADHNYGVVGANTLRTASQIGNDSGQADFNFGAASGQTLRVAALPGNATGLADFDTGSASPQTLRTVLEDQSRNNLNSIDGNIDTVLSSRASEATLQEVNAELAEHQSTSFTTGDGFASVTDANTPVLAANASRKYALIVNDSVDPIYLAIGTPAIANRGIRLSANGGSYEVNWSNLHTLAINGIRTAAGTSNVTVVEGV